MPEAWMAIIARFINAARTQARSVPRTHRSRAQNRHPASIPTVSTAAAMLVAWTSKIPCSAAKLTAALGFLSLIMLMINSATGTVHLLPNGAWERGSVYSITTWQLLTAACLLIGRRPAVARLHPD
jgi:hypothetical protein